MNKKNDKDKTVKSINNNVRSSVRKLNPILKGIVGKKVDVAVRDLTFSDKRISNDEKKILTDYAKMFAEVPELHIRAIQNNEKYYHDQIGAYVGYDVIESSEITGRMYSEIGPILPLSVDMNNALYL